MVTSLLPERLTERLSLPLEDNKQNFPEFEQDVDENRLSKSRERLLRLGLLHVTHPELGDEITVKGLTTISDLPPDSPGNTFELDRSLGLDKAVFFGWGDFQTRTRGLWVVADTKILFDDHVVVTPDDINAAVWDQNTPYSDLSQDQKDQLQSDYFDKMLTGKDWFDLIARRTALQRGRKVDLGGRALGEVKVFRNITPDETRVISSPEQKAAVLRQTQEQGFV